LVGKILAKRYVLLEELEAVDDPAGARFLAYDMNSLSRIKVVILRDDQGELDPEQFTLDQEKAKGTTEKKPLKSVPAAQQPVAKTLPLPQLGQAPGPDKESAATVPMERPPGVSEGKTVPMERPPGVSEGKTVPMERPPMPVTKLVEVEDAPAPTLSDALGRAFGVEPDELPPKPEPADSTQPLRLSEMEELGNMGGAEPPEGRLHIEPETPGPPGAKSRPETRRIEAAWFAIGDEMGDEDDPPAAPTGEPGDMDQAPLWQQASSLSRDEYQKFSLDLSPPAPPPAAVEGNPDQSVAGEIVSTDVTEAAAAAKAEAETEAARRSRPPLAASRPPKPRLPKPRPQPPTLPLPPLSVILPPNLAPSRSSRRPHPRAPPPRSTPPATSSKRWAC